MSTIKNLALTATKTKENYPPQDSFVGVDIGNTTITMAVVTTKKIFSIRQIETRLPLARLIKKLNQTITLLLKKTPIQHIVICSVVPHRLALVKKVIKKFKLKCCVVGQDVLVPMKNFYRQPQKVGQDRLVCSFAAKRFYGAPLIVIDFGTAITFDVVSLKGDYLGGIIVPGIRLTAESLFNKTALLPKVDIKSPTELIGRDTHNSILSGIFYGYGAMVSGLIQRISAQLRLKPKVVLTGGYSQLMSRFVDVDIDRIDQDLIFKGMRLLFEDCYSFNRRK